MKEFIKLLLLQQADYQNYFTTDLNAFLKKEQRTDSYERKIIKVAWNSYHYHQAKELRNDVLRRPSHLPIIKTAPIEEIQAIHLVIKITDEVVGTLFIDRTEDENVGQIKQVAVSPDYQGKQLSYYLMTSAEEVAKTLGYQQLILTARESAYRFYERLGYTAIDFPYQKDNLTLQLYQKELISKSSSVI